VAGRVLYLGPDVQQKRRGLVTPAAIVGVVVWLGASGALAFYSAHFGSYEKTWGTLSAVVGRRRHAPLAVARLGIHPVRRRDQHAALRRGGRRGRWRTPL